MSLLPLWLAIQVGEDDSALAERLRRREQQAMADLYDRYGRLAYSVILRIVRDSGIAEDLTQETFLRVWNRMPGFDPARGNLGAWLLAVARNRAIDYLRSVDGRMARSAYEVVDLENPALFANLEKEVLGSDQARRIRQALDKLNVNHRTVIELAYFEGLSQTEMAEKLSQPLGTVKTWVLAALKVLREDLAGATV
ncbi:MAG: sigma-70 family RNA polymerase sigma factor [Acidobacteria bacterium]|nr:sigma-70 family RNA polymerase sigma factor [Acidobacteriota bacterium]